MVTRRRNRITLASLVLMLAAFTLTTRPSMAEPISWMERYALSADREATLAELIPGSDDYYFYHCLHHQTIGQLDRSETYLKDWLAQHKGRETSAIVAMTDRQRLLTYNDSPQRTIDYLVRRLGIKLDHAPPAAKDQRRFPSVMDPAVLDVKRLVQQAMQQNDSLKPLGEQYVAERFISGDTAGLPIGLREFLDRINGAYIDGLVGLVIGELNSRRPNEKRFGDVRAHQYLTLDELRRVAAAVPQIADDDPFVRQILLRLRPDGDSDASQQPQVQIDYLTRVDDYVRTLPASYDSLKASAAYRLLEANLHHGEFDRELFLRYLQLPRVSPIVHQDWVRSRGNRAQLSDDFMDIALLPPIGDEQPLVRTYLEHFLRNEKDADAFAKYLRPEYLRRVFAECKLLHGVGNEQQWYKLLSESQRKQIRDAVELQLTPVNPRQFAADSPTELSVDIKNVDELVVRVYEINSQSYYRANKKPIDTDIDLDGLVATHERKLTFHQPSVQRHRELIDLPEIEGRGIWIVDLVGKGVRARALVRRGSIDYVESSNADGMVFDVIDERRQPIAGAIMWVGSRQFIADEKGRIVLPPVADRVSRRAILSDGAIATQIKFQHLREQYRLIAGMHLDRTQLQSGSEAELLIRPRLMMGRSLVNPKRLSRVSLHVSASDLEDIPTSYQVDDLELDHRGELKVPIRVPPRLASLTVNVSGFVDGIADSKEQRLEVDRTWDIAGIRRTNQTHDAFLTCDADEFVIDVRGRNGEIVPNATVEIALTSNVRDSEVDQTLQTDDRGQVRLGPLSGVTKIRYSVAGGLSHERDLELDQTRWPSQIHTTTERAVQLPLADPTIDPATQFRLLDTREGGLFADQTDQIAVDDGLLTIRGLSPGDYRLVDRFTGSETSIVVVDGPLIGSVVAGKVQHRSVSPTVPLGIASIVQKAGEITIQLAGDTSTARVHLYASRYLDQVSPIDQLHLPMPALRGRRVTLPMAGYVSNLRLGDEYQYVLRRRYVDKYPGVMLAQPSVILNPWETEETTNESQSLSAGEAPPPSAAPSVMSRSEAMQREADAEAATASSDYDFLADSGVVVANLRPDENGSIKIPAEAIEGLPVIQVVLCDAATIMQRTVRAILQETETVDLRLAKPLDASTPLSFEHGVLIASPDQPLDLKSLGSAQLQVYASVGDLLKLYRTLVDDPRLDEFEVLGNWHEIDEAQKLDAYSRLASHELHLFLWCHDRSFFDQVIEPYLKNKKEKQFIDHWLLGEDLSRYQELWRYNELNAAERALLAMKRPEARAMVQRQFRELVAQQQEDHAGDRRTLESALKSSYLGFEAESRWQSSSEPTADFSVAEFAFEGHSAGSDRSLRRKARSNPFSAAVVDGAHMGDASDMMFGGAMGGGGVADPFFRELDTTKQWAESHWDRTRVLVASALKMIPVDAYWADLAGSELDAIRTSTNILRPLGSRHAALVALATCGLPLSAGDVGLPTEGDSPYRPQHAVAVVTKRLKKLSAEKSDSKILIGQRFTSPEAESRSRQRNAVTELKEFLTGVPYTGQVVVSNPTARRQVVDVFWQLPAGSVPLAKTQTTDSRTLTLGPYEVGSIEYSFYFPAEGNFGHYPATVALGDQLVAQGAERQFTVVDHPSEATEITWDVVARSGSVAELREFLSHANLREIDWMLVAHRMRDKEVYDAIIDVLREANLPIQALWGYALLHRDEDAMRTFLSLRDDLIERSGPVLQSPLLDVDPIQRRTLELLEYAPLVRARVHKLGEEDEILNATFRAQYESFARVLGYSADISTEESLVLAYYLLIQNRISEAIETFDRIDREEIVTRLQYDYLSAYLAMHRERYDDAERIARTHADHKIPRWNHRFNDLLLQLRQRRNLNETEKLVSVDRETGEPSIREGSGDLSVMDRENRQSDASKQQPEVIVRVEGDSLRIDHRQAKEVSLNFYGVDLELLFSKAPFVREDLQRMAMVRPTRSEPVQFESVNGVGRFDLDGNLRRQTLLVEVVAGASRSTALYYGGDITTYVSESFGQLQTTDAESGRPISAAYVKVYARYGDGEVRFYKDGYTDARGQFDYASLSAGDARGAQRYAILVISDEKGATLHDVAAPNQ